MIDQIVIGINELISAINIEEKEILSIARIHDLGAEKYPAIWSHDCEGWGRIMLSCDFGITSYHRVLSISAEDDEEFDFRGSLNTPTKTIYEMVLVVCLHKMYDYTTAVNIRDLIPGKIDISGIPVFIEKDNIEVDEDEIVSDEFGDTDYMKYKSTHNVFKINYSAEVINCNYTPVETVDTFDKSFDETLS